MSAKDDPRHPRAIGDRLDDERSHRKRGDLRTIGPHDVPRALKESVRDFADERGMTERAVLVLALTEYVRKERALGRSAGIERELAETREVVQEAFMNLLKDPDGAEKVRRGVKAIGKLFGK